MRKSIGVLAILLSMASAYAQNCEVYIPVEVGTTSTYTNFSPKGKKESEHKQTLVSKNNEAGATVFVVRQEVTEDGKTSTHDLTYRCDGDKFTFDMKSYIDEEQMKSFKDSKVDITFDAIDIPTGAKTGTVLKDGSVTVSVVNDSPVEISFKTLITDRKIVAQESVTTSAGTFDCIKLTQLVTTDMGFMKMTVKSVEWLAKNVGVVKSESYSKADKLLGYMELTGVTK